MGLFDIFKKKKSDVEIYYEERQKRAAAEEALNNQYNSIGDNYQETFRITVQDVFTITGRGTVITGRVEAGAVHVGETVTLRRLNGATSNVTVTGIEQFRKICESAKAGENVGILLRGITRNDIGQGDVLVK
ncbi:MAG: hypothetical protein J6B39_07215 [Lachnospiraceae bacterium]|nr:hypothetical protein [Lachnospiraceae bacterium]